MMRRKRKPDRWVPTASKDTESDVDPLDEYLCGKGYVPKPQPPLGVPRSVVVGDRFIAWTDADWPGDAAAKELQRLYEALMDNLDPQVAEYAKKSREIANFGDNDEPLPKVTA
jgi:hypothetical protein